MKAVADTTLLIDYLRGIEAAKAERERYTVLYVSVITWIEVLAGAKDDAERDALTEFLADFTVVPVSIETADLAVTLRKQHRLRVPDAIIWATALERDLILVTRNTRDFPPTHPGIRIAYEL